MKSDSRTSWPFSGCALCCRFFDRWCIGLRLTDWPWRELTGFFFLFMYRYLRARLLYLKNNIFQESKFTTSSMVCESITDFEAKWWNKLLLVCNSKIKFEVNMYQIDCPVNNVVSWFTTVNIPGITSYDRDS
jgi:hypothetical protein